MVEEVEDGEQENRLVRPLILQAVEGRSYTYTKGVEHWGWVGLVREQKKSPDEPGK